MKFVCSPIDRPRCGRLPNGTAALVNHANLRCRGPDGLRSTIASGTVIRPMFTSRVHKAPAPRGHRQFILAKQEWR